MRVIVQRVFSGKAVIIQTGEVTGQIKNGLLVYFGIHRYDKEEDIDTMVKRVLNMKLFGPEDKRWTKSVVEMDYEILLVSQYTLYAFLNGRKPDFHKCMRNDTSKPFFEKVVQRFKELYKPEKIQTNHFGTDSNIDAQVDGPVNIIEDFPKEFEEEN